MINRIKLNKIKYYRIILILFVFSVSFLKGQTPDELQNFMETYNKLKTDQEANEIVKKGIESEKTNDDLPLKILVSPADINKYYKEKMSVLQNELIKLNVLFEMSDSLRPIEDFGYNFFSPRDSIPFIDNLKITDEYVLGYGDEVIFSVWGQVEQYEKLIERDGTVFIDNVGLLYLGGKTLKVAKSYINDRFARVYSTLKSKPKLSFINISLGKLKQISVSVGGHVNYPGSYVINPSINLTNLLIMTGGITQTGSLRNIFINRNNSVVDTVDLYPIISGNGVIKISILGMVILLLCRLRVKLYL